jgi:exonuclease III
MTSGPQNLHRSLKILSHNIRGISSETKWNSLRNNISDSTCDIICIQETKKESFDDSYIRRFCSRSFDKFEFDPSIGASGGFITIWKGSLFDGEIIDQNSFGHTIRFHTKLTNQTWWLTNIYAPSTPHRRDEFLSWFSSIEIDDNKLWIFLGDFNMIRSPDNRNKPGGDHLRMMSFNLAISQLGLQEIPLKGQVYTWSNMQRHPLLEKLDWCFVSQAWSVTFPATSALSLPRGTSDHIPWMVNVQINVPKPPIFRFENYRLQLDDFHSIFQDSWNQPIFQPDPAKRLMAKFKRARKHIHGWCKSLPNLTKLIDKVKLVVQLLDFIEESRDLTIQEWNFKEILLLHLQDLLAKQQIYWKQRGQIKWATLGDAGTKFFHANATVKHRHNLISSLKDDNGNLALSHNEKEAVLFNAFKNRLGTSQQTTMVFNLPALIQPIGNLSVLEQHFSSLEIDQIIARLPSNKSSGPDGFNTDFVKKMLAGNCP